MPPFPARPQALLGMALPSHLQPPAASQVGLRTLAIP